jgi:hypothetical protein
MTRTKKSLTFVIKIVNNDDKINLVDESFMNKDTSTNFVTLIESSQSRSITQTDTARKVSVSLKKVTKNARADKKLK